VRLREPALLAYCPKKNISKCEKVHTRLTIRVLFVMLVELKSPRGTEMFLYPDAYSYADELALTMSSTGNTVRNNLLTRAII
jgi:hypothetical protein